MIGMKKFIAFMVIALPLTAILSMAAGFYYAANARRVPVVMSEPAMFPTSAPKTFPTAASVTDIDARAYSTQMQNAMVLCYGGFSSHSSLMRVADIGSAAWRSELENALQGLDRCAGNMRASTPPASMASVHADMLKLAGQIDTFTSLTRASVQGADVEKLKQAQVIMSEMLITADAAAAKLVTAQR